MTVSSGRSARRQFGLVLCVCAVLLVMVVNGRTATEPDATGVTTMRAEYRQSPMPVFDAGAGAGATNQSWQLEGNATIGQGGAPLAEMLPEGTEPAAGVSVTALKRGQCRCWNSTEETLGEVQCRCLGHSIVRVPQKLTSMQRLILEKVGIKRLRTNALTVYADTLQDLLLIYLKEFHRIEPAAFAKLRHLRTLYIAHAPKLEFLPADVFEGISTKLKTLRIIHSGLLAVPDLRVLSNHIIMHMVDFDGNQIREIYEKSIQLKTDELTLDNNALTQIHGSAFHGSEIAKLSLKQNFRLKNVHKLAFVGIGNIRELDLSGTAIEELPTEGLAELEVLRIQNTHSLKTIPSVYNFRNLRTAFLTHSFHCCAFKFPARHDPDAHEQNLKKFYEVQDECIAQGYATPHIKLEPQATGTSTETTPSVISGSLEGSEATRTRKRRMVEFRNWFRLIGNEDDDRRGGHMTETLRKGIDLSEKQMGEIVDDNLQPITGLPVPGAGDGTGLDGRGDELYSDNPQPGVFHDTVAEISSMEALCGNLTPMTFDVKCYPMPDALNPCEDVMGSHWLRGSVWVVVLLAVFGNVAVVVVLFSNRSELTVPKFLICNLAFADLCMGLYLLLIASIDAHSMGEYFNYAFDWQYGVGCKVAGFLTVFASHLSVFTLTVVTLERWFAITHAIYLNRRIKLSAATYIMLTGWLYAITMAAMPLFGISNYSSTSICLPMETRDSWDIAYLLTVLVVNGFGFVVIVICYAQIYLSLGKETRNAARTAHSGEMTVAKKMALLVFTNFACWAPIAFFGLTAIAGYPLIGVSKSKILLVFFYPLNSCANPYLYAILTMQYRKDLFSLLASYGLCTQRAAQYKMTYSMPTNTLQVAPARGSVNYNSSAQGTITSTAGMSGMAGLSNNNNNNIDTTTSTVITGSGNVVGASNGTSPVNGRLQHRGSGNSVTFSSSNGNTNTTTSTVQTVQLPGEQEQETFL
ncbi:thyrotropin receptor-like isoform X1 [Anopheles albimanus]|uniref:thyrotropin receptor-like isoform X1 n=1 Tax=Anopheles albimanus TaxID=7167 RepID=UPI0016422505|nr:thyrotropin receptor-like isoform X1 [Anopheles albimanus]XP_035776704.1 thyrotropin receptor-like isoform X1 [Anopheles albimanus]XP_035776705.1 thyrotropin receptor-like isoform X1 [Anopheles albimanus]XP_035776706.1 thyrotropin receptor-like isoform X1 [Anopheles albimanus]XP_035776707.1 thyrotropin receptor-like isoform X1 [Anopheles albimanus]